MESLQRIFHVLGYASAAGGVNPGCAKGPIALRQSTELNQYLNTLALKGIHFKWEVILQAGTFSPEARAEEVQHLCQLLSQNISALTHQNEFFIVTGGDHTSAIGTWSGAYRALSGSGPLGLIWFDAHMDSHTAETTQTGRIHGMPLATLLGYGDPRFTELAWPGPKIQPEHLCLIGVRSFEAGEAELLKRLQVRVFFMDEIRKRGLAVIIKEAQQIVTQGTVGFGISLDVDCLDPREAPGVDVPEPEGISVKDLSEGLRELATDARLLGLEIVEFNPQKDMHQLTEKAIIELFKALVFAYA